MKASGLDSWVIEGSVDATSWTTIPWRCYDQRYRKETASFQVFCKIASRFTRLTQTEKNHDGMLVELDAIEFLGLFFEYKDRWDEIADLTAWTGREASYQTVSLLTTKYGGNDHENEIVTITSESVRDVAGIVKGRTGSLDLLGFRRNPCAPDSLYNQGYFSEILDCRGFDGWHKLGVDSTGG
jgi:hypothetical protein